MKLVRMIQNAVSTIFYHEATNWDDLQVAVGRVAASADDFAGEVYVEFNDSHVIHNSVGSGQEYTK